MSAGQISHALPEGRYTSGRIAGRCIGYRIEIEAPPETVWDFLADFEGWDEWNPLYVETSGRGEAGGQIRFAVKLEGYKPHKGAARVVTVRQNELLEYMAVSFAGLLKAFRFVEIEELAPARCAVTNGEIMGGPMGTPVSRMEGSKVGIGLENMNHALRRMAELKWKSRSGQG